jgi:hypothetical protein
MSEYDIYLSSSATDEEEKKRSKDAYSFRSNTFSGRPFLIFVFQNARNIT